MTPETRCGTSISAIRGALSPAAVRDKEIRTRMFPTRSLVCLLLVSFLGVTALSAQAQKIRKKESGFDGAVLVHIPAGWFVMGGKSGDKDERPAPENFRLQLLDR